MKKTNKTSLIIAAAIFVVGNHLQAQRIAAGGWHSLSVCSDSTIKAFGENASGQLGDGTTVDKSTAVAVAGLSGIVAVSGGGDQLEAHSMALKANGTVWAWGSNLYGGLGNGTTVNSMAPVQAQGLTNVKQISAGGWHSVALRNDGTVWAWGWNTDGQLGDGTVIDKSTPQQVPGLSGIVKIAAGTYHVLALKNDGTVWAWGDNVSGQIGDGTTVDKTSPVQVSGLTNIKSIAAGRFFSLAVKDNGTVWTWGENLYGQLGDGTLVDKSTPVQVSGLTNVSDAVVASGAFHCLAMKTDNTIWSWGRNTYGNLGDGTVVNSSVPVQASAITGAVGFAAGTNFSLLYKADGTVWGCGRNASGQLGDASTTQRNTFTQASTVCSVLQPVGMKEANALNAGAIKLFPNPSQSGLFYVHMNTQSETEGAYEITVHNCVGQTLLKYQVENNQSIEIDLSSCPAALYFAVISNGNSKQTIKLLKP